MKSGIGAAALLVIALQATQASAQSGNAGRGERLFNQQCKACHVVEKDAASPAGPNLNGVFGRKAGTVAGFEFSDELKNSGIVWNDVTLAEYNRDPQGKVPGTRMAFNGVKNATQLADLIAYLKEATK